MRHRLSSGPWSAFDASWFAQHQRTLIWLLALPVVGRLMRLALCIRREDCGYRGDIVEIGPHYYAIDNHDGTHTADVRTHPKYAKRVYRAAWPVWWMCHAWDWAVADRFVPRLSFGFATLTAYPDADPETTTVDGYVERSTVDETWGTIRSGAGNVAGDIYPTVGEGPLARTSLTTNQWKILNRVITLFDTSALSSGMIVSGTLSCYGFFQVNGSFDPDAGVYSCAPASNTSIVASDYGTFGSTLLSDVLTYAAFTTSGYNVFTLNSDGLAAVSRTGITKVGLRLTHDATNTAPAWLSDARSGFGFYLADETGSTKDPKLEVTYDPSSRIRPRNVGRPRPFAPGVAR
jgi:hypothetical protein